MSLSADEPLPKRDPFERHGLIGDSKARYLFLLNQELDTVKEAACLIYPIPYDEYEAAAGADTMGNDRRTLLSYLEDEITKAYYGRKLGDIAETRPITLSRDKVLNWADGAKLLDHELFEELIKIVPTLKRKTTRAENALRYDISILGAALSLVVRQHKLGRREKLNAETITSLVLEHAAEFFEEVEAPRGRDYISRLISSWINRPQKSRLQSK